MELQQVFIPKTISDFLSHLSTVTDVSRRTSELEAYVKKLEDEMRKIEVFKRELPLCMLLLNDAIEKLKEKGMHGRRPAVVEQFLPLKGKLDENGGVEEESNNDKKNWMSSADIGLNIFDYHKNDHHSVSELKLGNEEGDRSVPENPIEVSNNRGRVGAFVAMKGQYESGGFAKMRLKDDDMEVSEVPSLCLMTPLMAEVLGDGGGSNANPKSKQVKQNRPQQLSQQLQLQLQQQPSRKQRRCWSPDLHRRFVDALQQLGGTQATPKQIRELMQVDGLTNDEVKSHLQKYRLHIRKLSPSAAAQGNALWMTLDHSGDLSKTNNLQSGSPQGPLLAGGFAKGRSTTGGESGDSREAEEDEKSDGQSWNGGLQNNQGGNV